MEVRLYSVLNYNHIRYVRKLTKKVTYIFVCCDFRNVCLYCGTCI